MEAYIYGTGPKPDMDRLDLAFEAMSEYNNKNLPKGSPIMFFWP